MVLIAILPLKQRDRNTHSSLNSSPDVSSRPHSNTSDEKHLDPLPSAAEGDDSVMTIEKGWPAIENNPADHLYN